MGNVRLHCPVLLLRAYVLTAWSGRREFEVGLLHPQRRTSTFALTKNVRLILPVDDSFKISSTYIRTRRATHMTSSNVPVSRQVE